MLFNQLDQKTKTGKPSELVMLTFEAADKVAQHALQRALDSITCTTEINRAGLGCLNHAIEGLAKTGELR